MLRVSAILTTYNLENIISETINSLIGQSFSDFEIIIVDDGSSDSTVDIIKKYAQKFDFIKPLFLAHKGCGSARNEGYKLASGKYILFLDGDDVFDCDFLYNMYKKIEEEKADIVICNSKEFVGSIKNIKKTHFHSEYPIGWAWDKMIRKSLIDEYNLEFSNLSSSNDLSFVYSALFLSKKTVKIPDCLVYRRLRDNSVSSLRDEKNAFIALCELKQKLLEINKFQEFENDFQNISLRLILWLFNSSKSKEKRKKVLEYIRYYENLLNILEIKNIKYKKCFEFYKIAAKSKNEIDFYINYLAAKIIKIPYFSNKN